MRDVDSVACLATYRMYIFLERLMWRLLLDVGIT